MNELKLIKPTKEYENQVMRYKEIFFFINDTFGGCAGLEEVKNYDEWLNFEERLSQKYGKGYVPSEVYLGVRKKDNKVVGIIDFKTKSDKVYAVACDVVENYKFKIVTNHSWYNGGYGYADISNISDYPKLFTTDSDGNVITTTSFHLEINFEINDTKSVITITQIN